MFLVGVIALSACQVVQPTNLEAQQPGEEIQQLRDELLDAQDRIAQLETQVNQPGGSTALPPEPAPIAMTVEETATRILGLLVSKDYPALAEYVLDDDTIRFSPYGYIDVDRDLEFTRHELAAFGDNETVYVWGQQAGSGMDIAMNVDEYWERYVISTQLPQRWELLQDPSLKASNSIDNAGEVYPYTDFIEFFKPGTEVYGYMDWSSVKLALLDRGDGIYLLGIIHDEWTP